MVQEAYIHGISTRKVDDLVQALGMTGISKSEVSHICKEIDKRVDPFLGREITAAVIRTALVQESRQEAVSQWR